MKKIIFEKLTVKETAHILGAEGDLGEPPAYEIVACQYLTNDVIDCGNPAIPQIACSNTTPDPSEKCGI